MTPLSTSNNEELAKTRVELRAAGVDFGLLSSIHNVTYASNWEVPVKFGAIFMSRLSGAVGSSFWPENTQIELACVGPAVGLPFPVISPALAALALAPTNTAALIAATSNVFVRIIQSPLRSCQRREWRRRLA